jgi:hypothetical protein
MQFKYKDGQTMQLGDLFNWMQSAVYGDLGKAEQIPLVRRDLQRNYVALLSRIANAPRQGMPSDAQALARYELGALQQQLQTARGRNSSDLMTRAHIASLSSDVHRALNAQTVLPTTRTM